MKTTSSRWRLKREETQTRYSRTIRSWAWRSARNKRGSKKNVTVKSKKNEKGDEDDEAEEDEEGRRFT